MKTIILVTTLFVGVVFSGCGEKTLKEQKTQCLKEGKKFFVKKVLIHRTGEYEKKGVCK